MNMSASRQSRPPSITDEARAPREAPAESLEQQQVAAFDAAVPDRGIERHRHRRGRGIAVLADGQDDPLHGQVEPLRSCADDADVGLVWDEPVDLALLEVVFLDD